MAEAAAAPDLPGEVTVASAAPGPPLAPPAHDAPLPGRRLRFTKKRIALGLLLFCLAAAGAAYTQKDTIAPRVADTSRRFIGDENTARVEGWGFKVEDRIDKTKYRLFGGSTNPFSNAEVTVQFVPRPPAPVYVYFVGGEGVSTGPLLVPLNGGRLPMALPDTKPLRDDLQEGEGVWTTVGLPRSSPDDILMAKTFVRPDKSRPYALVGVLLMDARRIRLNIVGGTVDPGGDRGVKGPGAIPSAAVPNLLVAWNGGFKGPHGNYGMRADGKEYRPLRNGLATIAVMKNGTIKMGEWGKDLKADEDMAAARQNAVLLVQNGEVSKRTAEGNDTWGYVEVNSAEFITWRSAVGLTKEGNLLYAAGNSLSAKTLAEALWAAGAVTAMQLDINSPYVLLGAFFQQPDGAVKSTKFMDGMPDSPSRFLKAQERDFFYVTFDDPLYASGTN
jgi:hypothetical protein